MLVCVYGKYTHTETRTVAKTTSGLDALTTRPAREGGMQRQIFTEPPINPASCHVPLITITFSLSLSLSLRLTLPILVHKIIQGVSLDNG